MKSKFFAIFLLSLNILYVQKALAQDDLTKITRADGCVAYFPPNFDDRFGWSGHCKNGLAEGKVKFFTNEEANFVDGYMEGELNRSDKSGYIYKCNFVRSQKTGLCIERDGAHTNYVARFEGGRELEGSGHKPLVLMPRGQKHFTRQEGSFFEGQLNGYGKLTALISGGELKGIKAMSNDRWRVEGDKMIAEGLWQKGYLLDSCSSEKDCQEVKRSKDGVNALNLAKTQQCEAQKATCLASCPPYRSVSSKENSLIINSDHFDCKRRCESISCY